MTNTRINGGKVSAKDLKLLLNESYETQGNDIEGYKIDKSLSNKTTKVFTRNNSNDVFVVHRGSSDFSDWYDNYKYAKTGTYYNNRLRKARTTQQKVEDKYGAENVSTLGHSKGAKYAEIVGQNSKEIITLNKPTHISDLNTKVPEKQTDIKTTFDPVSAFRKYQRGNEPYIIKSEKHNPISEHSTETLDYIDPNTMFGVGLFMSRKKTLL